MDNLIIQENVAEIQAKITTACHKAGRCTEDVRLMAVTKTQSAQTVQTLMDCGLILFGENYPDETLQKLDTFKSSAVSLHMIGHLQSRKLKIVADSFDCFESLDRLSIAVSLNRYLAQIGRVQDVFLEINGGGEATKSGWKVERTADQDDFFRDAETICALPHLRICGLMTLPPYAEMGVQNRRYFVQMRELGEQLSVRLGVDICELSMGTSTDFETAIEEGATIVRVGTALVGSRSVRVKPAV